MCVPTNTLTEGMTAPPSPPAESDPSQRYNTKLTDKEEKQFQEWAAKENKLKDTYDYDLRGFWKDKQSFADNGHGSDKYKKPNHPTFSDQSQYHGTEGKQGGKWTEDTKGNVSFTPSETNLKNMSAEQLRQYFDKFEPGVKLNLPDSIAKKMRKAK